MKKVQTLLFDIDGTLLRTGGAGLDAMQTTMSTLFGIEKLAKVEVRGRTDCAIVRDLFLAHEIDHTPTNWREFQRVYHGLLPHSMCRRGGYLLPGVQSTLEELSQHSEMALGLLTGNSQHAAKIKLTHFSVEHMFAFGGFGDHRTNRNDVAQDARRAAAEHLGERFDETQVWVIGDTPLDVECGRAIGAKTVAVLTGGFDRTAMEASGPDYLLDDLQNFADVIATGS